MITRLASLFVAAVLFGQTSASPGGGVTNREGPGRLPRGPNVSGQNSPNSAQRSGSIFISGKVMLDDGSAPEEQVVLERICHGRAKPEGYTDSKGRFSFELGRNPALTSDASYGSSDESFGSSSNTSGLPGNRSTAAGAVRAAERDLVGCELRASLAGYISDVVNLSGRRTLDSPDVGTILLHRRANVEGRTTSATSLNAPKAAKKAYEKGLKLEKSKKPAEARKEFEMAVAAYVKYAAAWYELGLLHERSNRLPQAHAAYAMAIAADARFIKPSLQLAGLYALESKWKEAYEASHRVIQLNPYDFPAAYFYHSVASINLHDLDTAEQSAREGIKLDSDYRIPKLTHILGLVLAQKQKFDGAAESLKLYLKLAPNADDADEVRKQLAEVELNLSMPRRAPGKSLHFLAAHSN